MTVSVIHDGAITIKMVYADEGFLPAFRLGRLGIIPGKRFEKI